MVLTQGIFGLNLVFLLNHRGSSMNLGFESIHRVLTREFLSIKKNKSNKHSRQKQRNREERIQEARKDQDKDD